MYSQSLLIERTKLGIGHRMVSWWKPIRVELMGIKPPVPQNLMRFFYQQNDVFCLQLRGNVA